VYAALILVFKMGIQGAAIETVISQEITLVLFYIEYKRKILISIFFMSAI